MILSDKTIRDFIATGKIKIFPEFNLSDVHPAGIHLRHRTALAMLSFTEFSTDIEQATQKQYKG